MSVESYWGEGGGGGGGGLQNKFFIRKTGKLGGVMRSMSKDRFIMCLSGIGNFNVLCIKVCE